MPFLNDFLDFSDYLLIPPPSAQLFAESTFPSSGTVT